MPDWLKKFDLTIPLEFSKLKKSFQFLPPSTIEAIGSYVHNSLIVKSASKSSIVVDLLVEMPRLCIHKKDYLNNEYIEKRAIYLCYLAKKLKQTPEYVLEFSHLNDTTTNQAVLLVKPQGRSENLSLDETTKTSDFFRNLGVCHSNSTRTRAKLSQWETSLAIVE